MSEHDGLGDKHATLNRGTVIDNADPEKLGRVKVTIPGKMDESPWCLPLGGGGKKSRGVFNPPEIGADVAVLFHQGNLDDPHYIGGHYGKPGGIAETPGVAGGYARRDATAEDIPPEDVVKLPCWEGRRFLIQVDEREGKESFTVIDKKSEDFIEYDGAKYGWTIKGSTAVRILCDGAVDIKAATITLNGRVVAASGKPI